MKRLWLIIFLILSFLNVNSFAEQSKYSDELEKLWDGGVRWSDPEFIELAHKLLKTDNHNKGKIISRVLFNQETLKTEEGNEFIISYLKRYAEKGWSIPNYVFEGLEKQNFLTSPNSIAIMSRIINEVKIKGYDKNKLSSPIVKLFLNEKLTWEDNVFKEMVEKLLLNDSFYTQNLRDILINPRTIAHKEGLLFWQKYFKAVKEKRIKSYNDHFEGILKHSFIDHPNSKNLIIELIEKGLLDKRRTIFSLEKLYFAGQFNWNDKVFINFLNNYLNSGTLSNYEFASVLKRDSFHNILFSKRALKSKRARSLLKRYIQMNGEQNYTLNNSLIENLGSNNFLKQKHSEEILNTAIEFQIKNFEKVKSIKKGSESKVLTLDELWDIGRRWEDPLFIDKMYFLLETAPNGNNHLLSKYMFKKETLDSKEGFLFFKKFLEEDSIGKFFYFESPFNDGFDSRVFLDHKKALELAKFAIIELESPFYASKFSSLINIAFKNGQINWGQEEMSKIFSVMLYKAQKMNYDILLDRRTMDHRIGMLYFRSALAKFKMSYRSKLSEDFIWKLHTTDFPAHPEALALITKAHFDKLISHRSAITIGSELIKYHDVWNDQEFVEMMFTALKQGSLHSRYGDKYTTEALPNLLTSTKTLDSNEGFRFVKEYLKEAGKEGWKEHYYLIEAFKSGPLLNHPRGPELIRFAADNQVIGFPELVEVLEKNNKLPKQNCISLLKSINAL